MAATLGNEWTWGNDTPVWMRPRRTVYFIYKRITCDGCVEVLRSARGRNRYWKTALAVKKALAKMQEGKK